jgi:hypothetical protein
VELETAIVEHKHPYLCDGNEYDPVDKENLVAKVLKTRENQKTAKRSWKKLGRQIRGIIKPETLKRSRRTKIEVPDGDKWKKVEDKEIMEEHLMERNIEQFSHAGKTPFGYLDLGAELGHTGDSQMANDILEGTLQHECLSNEAIRAIVNQLREHPMVQEICNPLVTPEYFTSCFKCVPEKTALSYSGRSVQHYKACSQIKEEGIGELLASVYAAMMTVPLDAGFCPERWRKAVDVMLEKILGVIRTYKLRIIQLLEADLSQVLRSAFARNISKLAQYKYGIISEHQYGRSHRTCISPILNKLLTIQILI